jgi:hypothetical protein
MGMATTNVESAEEITNEQLRAFYKPRGCSIRELESNLDGD